LSSLTSKTHSGISLPSKNTTYNINNWIKLYG